MIILGASTLLSGDEFCGITTPVNPIYSNEMTLSNFVIDEVYIENATNLTPYTVSFAFNTYAEEAIIDFDEEMFINEAGDNFGDYRFVYTIIESENKWQVFCNNELLLDKTPFDFGITVTPQIIMDYPFVVTYQKEDTPIPEVWNYDTVLDAPFNGNTKAGNIKWTLDTVNGLLVKRRNLDLGSNWISIRYIPVNSEEDFIFTGQDYSATSGIYEYAIVPLNNRTEGGYTITIPIEVKVDRLTIIDADSYKSTIVTDGFCNTTYVKPSSVIEPLRNRYPTINSNASTCYQTIEVSASFYPNICDQNEGIFDDVSRVRYINEVLAMLTNGKPKILKNIDGRIWLVWITTPPSDSADEFYKFRTITFGCTEIGDINSEKNLYECKFINTPRMYWNAYQ